MIKYHFAYLENLNVYIFFNNNSNNKLSISIVKTKNDRMITRFGSKVQKMENSSLQIIDMVGWIW